VNSPSNPTGWVATVEEQEALCELATAHDVMLLADEVYERLAFDQPIAPSFARVAHDRDHLVVVNSFSKTFNMTGWRLGWTQASEPMIRVMTSAAEFMTSNPTAFVQQAGIVALRSGDSYVHDLRKQYAERRAQVMRDLPQIPGVSLVEPQGAFYAFMQIDGLTDSAAFTMKLLRESGLALAPGSAFGDAGEGYVRMCFAATEETLTRALDRFRSFLLKAQHV
jgi:aspartate aminotransferase